MVLAGRVAQSARQSTKRKGKAMITTNDDILDSRDIQERIDELNEMKESNEGIDEQDTEELVIWEAVREETEGSGWNDGITFIQDDYFETYARDLAEDIGAISRDTSWPCTCIDWEQATRELQMDYSSIKIDGTDYWYMEA